MRGAAWPQSNNSSLCVARGGLFIGEDEGQLAQQVVHILTHHLGPGSSSLPAAHTLLSHTKSIVVILRDPDPFLLFFFGALKSIFYFHWTVSWCDGRNRTRNIAVYTWRFSLLSYDRHPKAMTVTLELWPSPLRAMTITLELWPSP